MPSGTHGDGVIELQILDFAPDLAFDASNSQKAVVLIDMDNAVPTVKGYQALNSLVPYAEPGYNATGAGAPESVLGSTVAYFYAGQVTGTPKVFFGGTGNFWRLDGASWTGVGGIASVPGWRWRFTQFGDDLIAVNPGYPYAMVYQNDTNPTFVNLAGGPPNYAVTAIAINGQVMMFSGNNWYCSALLTDNNWTPDVQTQAGSGSLYDYPGPIVAAAPIFRNVIAFKQTATWIGSYVGGYPIWSWQLISDLTGTWAQESVITMPDSIAFVGADDFYVCSGYTPQRIPNNLKEWFFDIADPMQFINMLSRYDATHGVCYWYFVSRHIQTTPPSPPGDGQGTRTITPSPTDTPTPPAPPIPGVPDRWIAWNTRTGRWASGYVAGGGTINVPQPNQQPGLLSGLLFDATNVLRSWIGAPGTMRLGTSYFGSPNNLSQCMRARPIYYVSPTSATLLPYHVRNLGDADINGPTSFLNPHDGWYYFRQYDRWHRFTIHTIGPNVVPTTTSQTGTEISAIALELRQGGWR